MNAQMILDSSNGLPIAIVVCLITGYLFGSFPTGYVIGRLHHMDIRDSGSGNSGTTNALRTMGKMAGLLTFVGDVAKTMIPMLIVRAVLQDNAEFASFMGLMVGFGAVLGHNFPCWLKFKGGKGIAVTSSVIVLTANIWVTLIGLVLFIAIVAATRYVSVGSLMVALLLPIDTYLFYDHDGRWFLPMMIISICFTVLAYIRHAGNIKRLMNGTENKLGQKKA